MIETLAPSRGSSPRVRGKLDDPLPAKTKARGSSPRVRGKLLAVPEELAAQGLIPACAGKTSFGGAFVHE